MPDRKPSEEVQPRLYQLTDAARAEAELNGQRNAHGAFERIAAHGYGTADRAFREIGVIMLNNRVQNWAMPEPVAKVWLASALAQFEALVDGRGQGSGVQ